ncbi:hypothetical protein PR202_ga22657 [Eleusine coracana subsp. coracana]|uniref:Uncharacterized protein n=1 Tax=Eleusine coracana subsp. coracana TaxID=191504 RepID=A0AAV5D3V4_ELECO|nr:hypothetical protein PR202_ga22657 [Eleusine coracana subsp. coracana]
MSRDRRLAIGREAEAAARGDLELSNLLHRLFARRRAALSLSTSAGPAVESRLISAEPQAAAAQSKEEWPSLLARLLCSSSVTALRIPVDLTLLSGIRVGEYWNYHLMTVIRRESIWGHVRTEVRYPWKHKIIRKPGVQIWDGRGLEQDCRTSITLRKFLASPN